MGVDVKDLPPAYQAQALQKWAEQERKKEASASLPPYRCWAGEACQVSQQAHRAGDACWGRPAVRQPEGGPPV